MPLFRVPVEVQKTIGKLLRNTSMNPTARYNLAKGLADIFEETDVFFTDSHRKRFLGYALPLKDDV
jgi:hypothetical protein